MKREEMIFAYGDDSLRAFCNSLKKRIGEAKGKTDLAKIVIDATLYSFFKRELESGITTFYRVKTCLKEIGTKKALELDEMMELPAWAFDLRNKNYKKAQVEKLEKSAEDSILDEVDRRINELYDHLKDDAYLAKFAGRRQKVEDIRAYATIAILAYFTGRRLSEILNTLSIHKRGDQIKAAGLLKKREEEEELFDLCLHRKIEAKELQAMLRFVRKHFKVDEVIAGAKTTNLQNQRLNQRFNMIINRAIRKILDAEKLSVHDLRAYYAEKCFQLSGEADENKNEFIAKVLGHELNVTQTAYKNRAKK